jgi:hypothetical protein
LMTGFARPLTVESSNGGRSTAMLLQSLERHSLRSSGHLLDEPSSRRSSFRQGRRIRLADGQTWTLPACPKGSEWKAVPFRAEYTDIIRAILEAEDRSEQRLAELAFAIFLLGHNYHLSPADYERLLGSNPESPDSRDWHLAFHDLSQEHIHSFLNASGVSLVDRPFLPKEGKFSRLWAWLRNRLRSRWFSFNSRSF